MHIPYLVSLAPFISFCLRPSRKGLEKHKMATVSGRGQITSWVKQTRISAARTPSSVLHPLQPHRAAGNGRISISLSILWFVKKRGGRYCGFGRIDPRSVRDIKINRWGPNGNCHGKKGRWHAVDQTKFPLRPNPFQDNISLTLSKFSSTLSYLTT